MIVGEAHGQQFQNGKRRKFRVYYVWITRVWDEGLNMSVENRPENDVGLLMTDSGWQTKPEFRKVVLAGASFSNVDSAIFSRSASRSLALTASSLVVMMHSRIEDMVSVTEGFLSAVPG